MRELMFGYSDIVTTPPDSIGLFGYADRIDHGFSNNGVHDDLYASALCLKDGDVRLLIVTVDLCLMDEETVDMIRERVSEKTEIPVSNIMLSLSHTHSGPLTIKEHVRKVLDGGIEEEIDKYIEKLTSKIVSVCSQACSHYFKGKISSATFVAQLGYNRRYTYVDNEGNNRVKMLFNNWLNPGADANGPIDTNIPILMIERVDEEHYDSYLAAAGTNRIILFNAPIHPVVMGSFNRYVSAEYPGVARKCIEETLGDGTKAIFLLGACGNINALMACQNNFKGIEVLGNAIGYGVCAVLSMRKYLEFDGLKVITENISPGENSKAKRIVTQVFKIGKAAITAVSCENFTELGMKIREGSNFDQTLVASNSNGGRGYIPTGEAIRNWEGYEIDSSKRMGFDETLHDRIVETVIRNLKQLES